VVWSSLGVFISMLSSCCSPYASASNMQHFTGCGLQPGACDSGHDTAGVLADQPSSLSRQWVLWCATSLLNGDQRTPYVGTPMGMCVRCGVTPFSLCCIRHVLLKRPAAGLVQCCRQQKTSEGLDYWRQPCSWP
jgi:hypothetical protein